MAETPENKEEKPGNAFVDIARPKKSRRPQEYYDAEPWRGTWEFDGGAIMNQASHYVDLMQWLVGPVESVLAKTATQARRIEAEDSGVGILKFRSGALGSPASRPRGDGQATERCRLTPPGVPRDPAWVAFLRAAPGGLTSLIPTGRVITRPDDRGRDRGRVTRWRT